MEWPTIIREDILYDILQTKEFIQQKLSKEYNFILNHTYHSLWIYFPKGLHHRTSMIKKLKEAYGHKETIEKSTPKKWFLPVCYDSEFGWDLEAISQSKGITSEELISLHSKTLYTIYFYGFLPGFMYLGGLPPSLSVPRKKSPRTKVPAGSVAIGGNQTGIYPIDSPGGWQLIGKTPIPLFDPSSPTPCFAKAGDKIQFYQIDVQEFQEISLQVKKGVYSLKNERLNG